MLPRPLAELTFADIVAFVQAGLREGRTLDLKLSGVGPRDDDKREFMADVSAFANTAGGDILFGVAEEQGEATEVPGIELADADAEILRLEALLRTGLEPRLPRVDLRWLPSGGNRGVLIVRTPRSYISPHRVSFRDHAKFYVRTNAGKTTLDVAELRAAFLATEGLNQSIRRFRNERLGLIEAGEGPVVLREGAQVVLHVAPLEAFTTQRDIGIDRNRDILPPVGVMSGGMSVLHNIDGLVSFTGREDIPNGVFNYALLFRSGIIESASVAGFSNEHGPFISAASVEWKILEVLSDYRERLTKRGFEPPIYVFVSLLGVRGHRLEAAQVRFGLRRTLRTDALLLPEATITDAKQTDEEVLRPIFDRFWNAFGYARSFSFDQNGTYIGEKY